MKIKTNKCFIPFNNFLDITKQACDELIFKCLIKDNKSFYDCDRSSQSYCHGKGWCPLRFTEPWYTPRMRLDGTEWRHY